MNAMQLLSAPLAQAIGWALLHLLWQATIVAGILAAVLALLSRHSANTRYAVSCGALTLVFAMFVGTAYRAYEPRVAPPTPAAAAEVGGPTLVPVTDVPVLLANAATESWRDRAMQFVTSAKQYLPAIVAIWLAGVVFLSSRLLLSFARARRLMQRALEANPQWQRTAKRLSDALGLRRAVRLVESAAVEVPSVIGSLRPVILLPASALTGMTPEQIEMVLAHELAHIRRHDFLINLLQAVAETLMFYHPAVWWMSRRVRIERENCCDDLAIAVCGNPIQYARALTRLEELRAHAPAITVAATGGSLLERIRRIVAERAESTSSTSRWLAAIAMLSVVIIALAIPSLPALAERDAKKAKKEKEPTPAATRVEVVEPSPEAEAVAEAVAAPEAVTPAPEAIEEGVREGIEDLDLEDSIAPAIAAVMTEPPEPAPMAVPAPAPGAAPRAFRIPTPRPTIAPIPPRAEMRIAALEAIGWGDEQGSGRKFGTSGKLTVDELVALRNSGVTPAYVEQMRAVFPEVTLGDVIGLRHTDVTPDYVRNMRAAGVEIKTARDARKLRSLDVTPQWVQKLAGAGYTNLSVKELVRLAAAGIDENFIREMSKYRDKN